MMHTLVGLLSAFSLGTCIQFNTKKPQIRPSSPKPEQYLSFLWMFHEDCGGRSTDVEIPEYLNLRLW
jgi:hypothetical protein